MRAKPKAPKRNASDCCLACGKYNAPGDPITVATLARPDGHVMVAEFCRRCYRTGRMVEYVQLMTRIPTPTLDKVLEVGHEH